MGCGGSSSVTRSTSGMPYTAAEDENTTSRTSALAQAASTLARPAMLSCQYISGFSTDSPTCLWAAKWITESAPEARIRKASFSRASGRVTSSSNSSAPSVRRRRPVERSSTTTTSCPCSSRSRTTCDPMYPAPPITRVVMVRSYRARRRLPAAPIDAAGSRRGRTPASVRRAASAPGAGDGASLVVAGRALQADHGPLPELGRVGGTCIRVRGADPGGDLVEQVLDPAAALGEEHARGGDALLEQSLAGAGEGVLVRGAVRDRALGGHAEGCLVAPSALVRAHLAGRLVGAGEPGPDHHVGRAGGERERDVPGMAHPAVGPDAPAEPARLGRALHHGGELGAAHPGHHPGGAHGARPDADLDDVGSGLDQLARALGGDDVARREPHVRALAGSEHPARGAQRLDHPVLVAVGGVEHDDVGPDLDELTHAGG